MSYHSSTIRRQFARNQASFKAQATFHKVESTFIKEVTKFIKFDFLKNFAKGYN